MLVTPVLRGLAHHSVTLPPLCLFTIGPVRDRMLSAEDAMWRVAGILSIRSTGRNEGRVPFDTIHVKFDM